MSTRASALLLLTCAVLAGSTDMALASCVPRTPSEQGEFADVVFVGTLTEIDIDPFVERLADDLVRNLGAEHDLADGQVTFEVTTVLKGRVYERQRVAHLFHSSVSVDFVPGRTYTVFAKRLREGYLFTDECSGTVAVVIDTSRYGLSPGSSPEPGYDANITGSPSRLWPIGVGAAMVVLTVAAFAAWRRRTSR